ncbi:MAG: GNAT family N-acetyltransferase [Candidatus Margulisiibacteriota bacterium]|jgi:ribosomal protein S18 acetylase RimI-like enzyme
MRIEQLVTSDLQSLKALQPADWTDILPIFAEYIAWPFCLPVKVMIDNKLVGTGAAISFNKTGWIAHIIVHAKYRKKGLGSSIVDHLCKYLKSSGCETISLIATELGCSIYKKAGFVEQTEYLFFQREGQLLDHQPSAELVLCTDQDTEGLLALDQRVSGEDRRGILNGKLAGSVLYKKNDQLLGYCLPMMYECPVVAETLEAGLELMRLRLSATNMEIVPVDNITAIAFLKENGFAVTKKEIRMIWGKAFSWQPEKIFNRIGGNFG